MRHQGTRALETERLTLRRFVLEDAEPAFANWVNDSRVTRFLTWQPHVDITETRRVLQGWISSYDDPKFYQWAIEVRDLGQPIGSISVVSTCEEVGQMEVGYCIGVPWWRQGYTSEALGAVRDYLFDEVGILRLQARHDPDNPGSGAVMRACGLQYEGTLRGADRSNRGIVDVCVYGLLAGDR